MPEPSDLKKDELDAPPPSGEVLRVIPRLSLAIVCLLLLGPLRPLAAAPDLTATDILHTVREAQGSRHEALEGQLRNDSDGRKFPFRLVANGPQVRYEFPGPPPVVVQVRYEADDSQLQESTGGGATEKLTSANFDKKIFGTDLAYEDLALRFVYWSRATLLDPDDATTLPAYKIRLGAPGPRSQYGSVIVWIGKDNGGLLRAEGYNTAGKLIKRFDVRSGQKLAGKWYLKQLRIESVDPKTQKVNSRSYLEIKGLAN